MGIARYTRIMSLFDEAASTWTVTDISDALDTSASTIYRQVRELVAAGFLEHTVEARLRLGPVFIEYARRIRMTDPLILSGVEPMQSALVHVGVPCTAVLARLYGPTVMCVAQERSANAVFHTSYELGRPMPLVRGATSKAVLSTLAPRALTKLLGAQLTEPEQRDALKAELALIRKTGYCLTRGEVDSELVGLATPVANAPMGITASFSFILHASVLNPQIEKRLQALATSTACAIEANMEARLISLSFDPNSV